MLNVKLLCLLALSSSYTFVTCAKKTTVIQKCCPPDKKLDFMHDGPSCQALNKKESNHTSKFWWWLPKDLIVANDGAERLLDENPIEYKIPDCHIWSMEILRYINENETDFDFHVRGGEIRLSVLVESSYHDLDATRNDSFPPHTYCADRQGEQLTVLACPCLVHNCVRDCCGQGKLYNKREKTCVPREHDEINGRRPPDNWIPRHDNYTDYYKLIKKWPVCENGHISHVLNSSSESQLLLLKDGSIKVFTLDGSMEHIPKDMYCATYNVDHHEEVIFCRSVSVEHILRRNIYGVMFLIGAFCLFLTVVITLLLPEMRRNIHGKMAVAHNFMLCIGHLVMGILQMDPNAPPASCKTMSLIIQFTMLAAFFWLNVMCVDISWTFSGLRHIKGTAMQRDRKKFIYYSLYAWGSTSLISMATLIVEFSAIESNFKPNFGTKTCLFNNRGAEFLFFFGPMALILATNLALFTYTAYKIISVKKETSILKSGDSSTSTKNKQTLILYVKLFLLMGVTWVTEVISWAVGGPTYLWYVTDIVNLLRAVFIFVIFCCKRAVYIMLQNRVRHCLGKEPLGHSTSRGQQSSSSQTRNTAVTSITPNTKRKFSTQSTDNKIEGFEMSRIPRKSKDSIHDGSSKQDTSTLLTANE